MVRYHNLDLTKGLLQSELRQPTTKKYKLSLPFLNLISFIGLPPGVNFTNLMVQSANAPAVIILRHSVSPAKLCPIFQVNNQKQQQTFTLNTLCYAVVRSSKSSVAKVACKKMMKKMTSRLKKKHNKLCHRLKKE